MQSILQHNCLGCLVSTNRTMAVPVSNAASHRLSSRKQLSMAAAASGVHGADTKSKPTKKTISPSHKQRLRKKANSWGQPDTPNKGLVLVTQQMDVSEAAAGLTKELKQGEPTRLVAASADLVPKAIDVLNAATEMLNSLDSMQQQSGAANEQETGAEAGEAAAAFRQLVVFQPVEVSGVLAASPAIPEGATAFYSYKLRTDSPAFHEAICQQEKQAAAAAATSSDGKSRPRALYEVGIGAASDVHRAGEAVVKVIQRQGWAQLTCHGGPVANLLGMKAILSARAVLAHQQQRANMPADICAVPLQLWEQSKHAEAHQHHTPALEADKEQQQLDPPAQARPQKRSSFLLLGCDKNKPFKLHKLPLLQQ